MPTNKCFAANNILLACVIKIRSCVKMADQFTEQAESDLPYLVEQNNGDRMMKQLLNSVIAKYRDLSVSRRSIICLSPRLRQIIDLLATGKSQYFAQPRSIIVKCFRCSPCLYFAPSIVSCRNRRLFSVDRKLVL